MGDRAAVWGFILVAAFFMLIQVWSLTGPTVRGDERLYFFSAHHMVQSGDWLTPKDEFSRFRVHKPPLYTWATALAFKLAGGPSLALQRAVSLLSALGTAGLVFMLSLLLFNSIRAAALAGIAVLGFTEVFLTCHQGRADALFMFLITAAIYAWARVLFTVQRPLVWTLAGYLLAALAFLAKGPYGLLHPLLPALATALILPRRRPRIRYLLHPLGLALFIAVAGVWYAALVAVHTKAVWGLVMTDMARHGPGGNLLWNLIKNAGNYLPAMLTTALPWWPLLILGIFTAGAPFSGEGKEAPNREAWVSLAAWAGAVVLTVFVNPTWARRYILPLYPALAVAAGVWLSRLGAGPERLKNKALPGVLAVLSLVFGAALIPLAAGGFRYGGRLTDGTALLLPSALLIAGLVVLLWVFRQRAVLVGWVACLACLSILVNGAYDRNYNVAGNRGAVARLSAIYLAPLDPGKVRVFCLGMHWADCLPILDRGGQTPLTRYVLDDPSGIIYDQLAFGRKGRATLAVTMARHWEKMDPELKSRFEVVRKLPYSSLVRGKGVFLGLDRRTCLLLRLKEGEGE